jgi:HSP20 family molecular chaperone IbpA
MDDVERADDLTGFELETFGAHGDLGELIEVKARIEALAARDLLMGPVGPRADLLDAGDAWQLRLEVPGVDQSRLELALQGEELVIAGIRETLDDGVRPVFVERPSGPFQRVVRLPGPVDAEAVTANLRGGLLVVNLPKRR